MLVTVLVSMARAAWFADDPEHEEGFMRGMVIDEVGVARCRIEVVCSKAKAWAAAPPRSRAFPFLDRKSVV